MLSEFADVAGRDKFYVTGLQIERFLLIRVKMTKIVPDNARFIDVASDPDDDVILNAAYMGKADYLVTGDKHLLKLNNFKKTKIVTVNQMLEILLLQ